MMMMISCWSEQVQKQPQLSENVRKNDKAMLEATRTPIQQQASRKKSPANNTAASSVLQTPMSDVVPLNTTVYTDHWGVTQVLHAFI